MLRHSLKSRGSVLPFRLYSCVLTRVVSVSWKSTLIIALDACFKLKLKDRSFVDPDLGTGLAYMVNEKKYQLHLAHCAENPLSREVSAPHLCIQLNSD